MTFSVRNRRRKAQVIGRFLAENHVETVLLVGAGGGQGRNERIVEKSVAAAARVLATCDLWPVKHEWPHVVADGRRLPFRDKCADAVVSSAVVEHVGTEVEQRDFVSEHVRVGHCFVITTPNRWFPVESHTSAVLRHWSPAWRGGRAEFTRLLSRKEFRDLLPKGAVIRGRAWSATYVGMFAPARE